MTVSTGLNSPTAGIQEALAQSPCVFLPRGQYDCYAPIVLPATSCSLYGELSDQLSIGSTINNLHGGHTIVRPSTSYSNEITNIHDLSLVGNPSSLDGINAVANSGMRLANLWIRGHRHGIYFDQVFHGRIVNCIINGNALAGIRLHDTNNVTVDSCATDGNKYAGVMSEGTPGRENRSIRILNCDIEGNGTEGNGFGISLSNTFSYLVSGCYFETNALFELYAGSNTLAGAILANHFLGKALTLDTAEGVSVTGNYFEGPQSGIRVPQFRGRGISIDPTNVFRLGAFTELEGVVV